MDIEEGVLEITGEVFEWIFRFCYLVVSLGISIVSMLSEMDTRLWESFWVMLSFGFCFEIGFCFCWGRG